MDFSWSAEQEAVRDRVRSFIDDNLPADWESTASLSPGSEAVTNFSKVFCPKLAEAGLLISHWPEEFGGRSASAWEHVIIGEQLWQAGEPRGPQYYNVNWIGPDDHALWVQRAKRLSPRSHSAGRRYLEPGLFRAFGRIRSRFAQNQGGARWRAVPDQRAKDLDVIRPPLRVLLPRRANRGEAPRCHGFLLPMERAGIIVRPIDSVVGDGDLHEVFFDDVEVFDHERLGTGGAGWDVVRYALNFERVGIPRYALALRTLSSAVGDLEAAGALGEAARQAAAAAYASCEAARLLSYEAVDQRMKGAPGTGTASVARYAVVLCERQVADFVLDWTPHLFASNANPMVATHHKRAIAAGLAAGAAEIQLNLIARDVLGLGA